MQSADGTRCARLARSRHASRSTQSGCSARPSASAAGEGNCSARTARSVLVTRDRDAPAAAHSAAVRCCPSPEQLGRATAARERHAPCSSRAIATRRRRHTVWPLGTAFRQRGWGGRLWRADGTGRARHARSHRAGGGNQSSRWARPSASAEGPCASVWGFAVGIEIVLGMIRSRSATARRRPARWGEGGRREEGRGGGDMNKHTPQDPLGPRLGRGACARRAAIRQIDPDHTSGVLWESKLST
jgi:hypothetical protein